MKITKTLVTALSVLFTAAAMAAGGTGTSSTSTTNLNDWYAQLKESPFSFTYITEVSNLRDKQDKFLGDGVSLMNWISAGYKIDKNHKVSLVSRWDRNFSSKNNNEDRWTNTELNFSRSNILTEEKHGVGMTFTLRQRFYMDNLRSEIVKVDGKKTFIAYTRPGFNLKKKLTNNLSLSWSTHLAVYNRVTGVDGQKSHYFYTYPVLSYSLSDKLSVSLTNEFFKRYVKGDGENDAGTLDTTIGADYQLTSQVGLGATIYATTMKARDERFFADNISKSFGASASATISVF